MAITEQIGAITEHIQANLKAEYRTLTTTAFAPGFNSNGAQDTIPAGQDVRLFNSKDLDIVHEGNGNLILYKCEIKNLICKKGTYIHLYDCKILNKLELYGTTGLIEGSTVEDTEEVGCTVQLKMPFIIIEQQSDIEFLRVNFRNMHKILEAKDSKITFQECRNRQELYECIFGENVRLKLSRCKFFSTYRCIELVSGSSLDVMSCHLKGYLDMCVAMSAGKATLTDCNNLTSPDGFITDEPTECKGLFGAGAVLRISDSAIVHASNVNLLGSERLHDYGIECDFGAKATFTSTTRQNAITGGGFAGIKCAGLGSSVTVINYETINSKSEPGIIVQEGAKVFVSNIATIFSADVEAINVNSKGILELDNVKSIEGKTWGIVCEDGAKLTVNGRTNLINGSGDDGIIATANCELSLTDVTAIIGQKSGIKTSDNCKVSLFGVQSVLGSTVDGLTILDGGRLLAKFTGFKSNNTASDSSIKGQLSGIKLSSGVRGVLIGYNLIEGQDLDALSLQEDCQLTVKNVHSLQGEENGISMSNSSRLNCSDVALIKGSTKNALIATDGCSATLQDIETVEGELSGITFTGANDYLHIANVGTIQGTAGNGISADVKGISVRDVASILASGGTGIGVELKGATGQLIDIGKIDGIETGLLVKNSTASSLRSDISATRIRECIGIGTPWGLAVIISKFYGTDIGFTKDGFAENSETDLNKCTFGGAFTGNDSSLKFSGCRVDGQFEINRTSFDILNTRMKGEHISVDSSGTSRNYIQEANYTASNEGAIHTNFTLGGSAILRDSDFEMKKGTITGTVVATDSVVCVDEATVTGHVIIAESTLEGKTSAFDGGIDISGSSVQLHTCTSPSVTLGTGSSLLGHSGELGAIEVTDGALQLHSTNAVIDGLAKAAIICNSGSIVQGGSHNRYDSFNDHVHSWFGKDYKIRVDNDLQLNAGVDGGTIEVNGKDGVSIRSHQEIYSEAASVTDNVFVEPSAPREPEVVA